MKLLKTTLTTLVGIALLSGCSSDEKKIKKTIKSFEKAVKSQNVKKIQKCLEPKDKEDASDFINPMYASKGFSIEIGNIDIEGNEATCKTKIITASNAGAEDVDLIKIDKKWLIDLY